jgi:hypothetical protein
MCSALEPFSLFLLTSGRIPSFVIKTTNFLQSPQRKHREKVLVGSTTPVPCISRPNFPILANQPRIGLISQKRFCCPNQFFVRDSQLLTSF